MADEFSNQMDMQDALATAEAVGKFVESIGEATAENAANASKYSGWNKEQGLSSSFGHGNRQSENSQTNPSQGPQKFSDVFGSETGDNGESAPSSLGYGGAQNKIPTPNFSSQNFDSPSSKSDNFSTMGGDSGVGSIGGRNSDINARGDGFVNAKTRVSDASGIGSVKGNITDASGVGSIKGSVTDSSGIGSIKGGVKNGSAFPFTPGATQIGKATVGSDITHGVKYNVGGDTEAVQGGYYNRMRGADMTQIANAMVESSKAMVQDSDAMRGYRESKHKANILGAGVMLDKIVGVSSAGDLEGTLLGHSAKYDVDGLNKGEKFSVEDAVDSFNKSNGTNLTFRVGDNLTGFAANDFQNNLNTITKILESNGINASVLSVSDIERALKKGKLGKIDLKQTPQTEGLLKELLFLKKNEHKYDAIMKGKGGIKSLSKTWSREMFRDSDAGKGMQMTQAGISAAKAGFWVAKGSAAVASTAVVTAGSAGAMASGKVISGGAKLGEKVFAKGVTSSKWQAVDKAGQAITKSAKVAGEKGVGAINSINKFSLKKEIKGFLKRRFSLADTKVGKAVGKALKPVAKVVKPVAKVFGLPGAALAKIKLLLMKVVLGYICALAVCFIILLPLAVIPGNSEQDDTSNLDQSIVQKSVDYVNEYQIAYAENIAKCEEGSEYFDKGCPDSWKDQLNKENYVFIDSVDSVDSTTKESLSVSSSGTINCSDLGTPVYKNGKIWGYNLKHYWGPEVAPYKTTVKVLKRIYETVYYNETVTNPDGTTSEVTKSKIESRWITEDAPMTVFGVGDMKDGKNIGPETAEGYTHTQTGDGGQAPKFETTDHNSTGFKDLATRENQNVTITYNYFGSDKSYKFTPGGDNGKDKCSTFKDSSGHMQAYSKDTFYKMLVTMFNAFSANSVDHKDLKPSYSEMNLNYCKLYMKTLMDKTVGYNNGTSWDGKDTDGNYVAQLSITTYFVEDPSKKVKWNFTDYASDGSTYVTGTYEATGYTANVHIGIDLLDTGLQDAIKLDTEIDPKIDNDWAHNNESYGSIYSEKNPNHKNYKEWEGWFNNRTSVKSRPSAVYTPILHENAEPGKKPTRSHELALMYYELETKEFEEIYQGLKLPTEHFKLAGFGYNGNFGGGDKDYEYWSPSNNISHPGSFDTFIQPNIGVAIPPVPVNGGKKLDMLRYINQADQPWGSVNLGGSSETVQQAGCFLSSLTMIYEYYTRKQLDMVSLARDRSNFCNNSATLNTPVFLAKTGMQQSNNLGGGDPNAVIKAIMENANNSRPTLLHIRGKWTGSNGDVYHNTNGGHFLVAVGYTSEGIMVYDPGRRANTCAGGSTKVIPYAEWGKVADLYYRNITMK